MSNIVHGGMLASAILLALVLACIRLVDLRAESTQVWSIILLGAMFLFVSFVGMDAFRWALKVIT